jgi:hypothetical protein
MSYRTTSTFMALLVDLEGYEGLKMFHLPRSQMLCRRGMLSFSHHFVGKSERECLGLLRMEP